MKQTDISERFWMKVDRQGEGDCWPWHGATSAEGYGYIGRGRRGEGGIRAHRLSYELLVGPIPEGLVLDHLCRNTGCVNPNHLEPVTQAENMRRAKHTYANKQQCKHGHDITDPANVYTRPSGRHECRTCMRERQRRTP